MNKKFSESVYQVVKQIPKGKVATYGQIAAKLGKPKAARAVGKTLHANPYKSVPCHRVVNREGKLAENYGFSSRGRRASGPGGWREQKRKLMAEGVRFKDRNHVDLRKSLITNF